MKPTKSDASFLKYLIWELLIPLGACSLFMIVFSILELNYYYLPYSLNFTIQLSYNISYYLYSASIFLICGIASNALLTGKASDKTYALITGTFSIVVIPFVMYLIKHIFLATSMNLDSMAEYFNSDIYALIADGVKYVIFLIPVVSLAIYYFKKSIPYVIEKPYFLPKSSFQITTLVFYSAWFFASILIFAFQNPSDRNISGLIVELIYSIAGYFLTILGYLLFFHRKKETV